jgi:hypothetical protein
MSMSYGQQSNILILSCTLRLYHSHRQQTMLVLAFLYAALCGLFAVSSAHNIQLKAHSRECFHEELHSDDKMTVTFQVGDREFGGSGNLDIDFWVGSFLEIYFHLKRS